MNPNETPHSENGTDASAAASDHSLLERYRLGNQDAAREIYLRYAQRLRALAQAQISGGLAGKVEADDIVQSVFGSFFRGVNNAFYDVPQGEELWKILLVIALHKIRNEGTYHRAEKRDVRRTVSAEAVNGVYARVEDDAAARAFLQMVVDEALGQISPQQKQMVEMRMEGYSVMEIAKATGRAKRTVERQLQQARAKLGRILEIENAHDPRISGPAAGGTG